MITCEDIHFQYRNKVLFKGLDWSLKPGRIYGLLGKNGAGKTTLLHCICGLLKISRGSIRVLNLDPSEQTREFKTHIFLVPESFYLPAISMDRLLYFYQRLYPRFEIDVFNQLLNEFALGRFGDWKQLSFGQKKKLLIALAIASQAEVILFDEPTNGLDIPAKHQFNKSLARFIDDHRIIIVSTHHVRDVESMLDHVSILEQGAIMVDEPVSKLAERYAFGISFDKPAQCFYAEPSIHGYQYVREQDGDLEGQVDIELFYKAFHANPGLVSLSKYSEL